MECSTNRFFNAACIPYIFQELNILDREALNLEVILKHAQHIRTARILIDPPLPDKELRSHQSSIEQILSACSGITSLGCYYQMHKSSWGGIPPVVVSLLERGTIQSLGIYSLMVVQRGLGYWDWNYIDPAAAYQLLDSVASSPKATASIKRLDIAWETMPQHTYDLVRSNFINIRSLSVRRAFRVWAFDDRELGRLWDEGQPHKWKPYANLTTLNLIDCSNAYAPHIPKLVRLFDSLRHLLVSTCGYSTDKQAYPDTDWHSTTNALWKVRPSLVTFHMEHMLDWEILALGIIPTRILITSNLHTGHLAHAFNQDQRIFPGLQHLSLEPLSPDPETGEITDREKEHAFLEEFCKRRSVELSKDASYIKRSGHIRPNFNV
jgi:hypothetical protein